MSDLAKKCADGVRAEVALNLAFDENKQAAVNTALAAFIEAAQEARINLRRGMCAAGERSPEELAMRRYDAALRDLAQSMEVE